MFNLMKPNYLILESFNKKALKYALALVQIGFYLIFFVNPQLDLSGTELVFEIAVVKLVLDSICYYAV